MYITKIVINNFRIYYGENVICFPPLSARNVLIISGNNGYGKTTLLTALVWCLYGNQIQEVDEFFKEKINVAGGYKHYLQSGMNRLAAENNEAEYYVSIDLKNVKLPGISCDTMQISRSYNVKKSHDLLKITIDGNRNELVDEIGQQIFIQDFVLPKEIAKLFFFDAEKIVRLAEVQSLSENRLLSQAYSEVLGIKKYQDLRDTLNDLRLRFRKESATEVELVQFKDLGNEISRLERLIRSKEETREQLINEKSGLRIKQDQLQEKLLREGNALSVSQINALREQKAKLAENQKELINEFKELFELAPFAIMGKSFAKIEQQLVLEDNFHKTVLGQDLIKTRIDLVIDNLRNDNSKFALKIDDEVKEYYLTRVSKLVQRYFVEGQDVDNNDVKLLHNFGVDESNKFAAILANLRTTYKERLQDLKSKLRSNALARGDISKKLLNAESKENDILISNIREERKETDETLGRIDAQILELSREIGALENTKVEKEKQFDEVAKKIKVNKEYRTKDELVSNLVDELDEFLYKIKLEKKHSFEERLLSNLQLLMHKQGFISRVSVDVSGEIINISLMDRRKNEIKKEELSKGEQQLYATALLKSLVEESGIEFPVFVDSPLQKFDNKHSRNVITNFYPTISKQVIILPLQNKEMNKEEYDLLLDHVGGAFLIENVRENSSKFLEVNPNDLFGALN